MTDAATKLKRPQILVVDDEPAGFDVIEGMLFGQDNYQLSYASSGSEAMCRIKVNMPDVILLDVMMPDVNGLEVCRWLKTSPKWQHIPIIMVTALNSKEDLARCLEIGADDFICKPVNTLEIRARIRSMLRLKQQYDELNAVLELRQDMANMIVHDLRNPLTTVVLASEVLKLTSLTPKQTQKVQQISIATQQLDSMVNSLLAMAKLEAGKLVLDRQDTDLGEMLQTLIHDWQAIASQRRIQLQFEHPSQVISLAIDPSLIRRVLENLLSNAIKFSPSDSVIQLCVTTDANQTQIQVIDNGSGINEEHKQYIFEKYEIGQILNHVSQTGLGLAFCKLVVEAHDGQLLLTDHQPTGSIFTIAF